MLIHVILVLFLPLNWQQACSVTADLSESASNNSLVAFYHDIIRTNSNLLFHT